MAIENVLERLNKEFGNDPSCPIEIKQNQRFYKLEDNSEYSSYLVNLVITKNKSIVMTIQYAENASEKDRAFYFYQHYCPEPHFYAVLLDNSFLIKERPYIKLNKEKQNKFSFDSAIPYDSTETRNATIEDVIEIIKNFNYDKDFRITKESICEIFNKCANIHKIDISSSLVSIEEKNIEFTNTECWLDCRSEIQFMTNFLNDGKTIPSALYRYTSARNLERIFNGKESNPRHSMSSLATMNDTTEIDYANNYLRNNGIEFDKEEFEKEKCNSIHAYITSLSEKEDDLTMWRLYGDNTKGISFVYDTSEEIDSAYFMLAWVSYADKNRRDKKLDFIIKLMKSQIGNRQFRLKMWNIWQHFFKPYDYNIEGEIRLLAFADEFDINICNYERKWITTPDNIFAPILYIPLRSDSEKVVRYPLTIKRILLGCNFTEKDINKITWEYKIKDEYGNSVSNDFKIEISNINNYR